MNYSIIKNHTSYIPRILVIFITILIMFSFQFTNVSAAPIINSSHPEVINSVQEIFQKRNDAILKGDSKLIESIYDRNTKYGTWAFQYEQKKMKYIHNWEEKQGIKFTNIKPSITIKSIKGTGDSYSINLMCSTEYKYVYINEPSAVNVFRTGSYHVLTINNYNGNWLIIKEWYKDPFGDDLNLDSLKVDSIKQYILAQSVRDFSNISSRRISSVEYADKYCGAASDGQNKFKYNKKFRDYNSKGGDCANFASQILFEGGKFKKNSSWNYDTKGATGPWLNAYGFKSYMIYSGRGSLISYGNYEQVYKSSYKLLPGDFIAYEKKGDVMHISTVTGADSKGYSLVSCHNSDRNKVPWDLGWNGKNIKFWLVHVNY